MRQLLARQLSGSPLLAVRRRHAGRQLRCPRRIRRRLHVVLQLVVHRRAPCQRLCAWVGINRLQAGAWVREITS